MIYTPSGKISAKQSIGQTWKRKIRIEKVARLCKDAVLTNEQIATHLNLTPDAVIKIKASAEFQRRMIELTTGVMQDLDQTLDEIREDSMSELAAMIPAALLTLRNSLLSKNENIQMKAALEILDREGTNAKVSKVNVKHEAQVDLGKANQTSFDILALLGRPVGEELDQHDVTIAGGFTISASDASSQVKNMSEAIDEKTLEALDLSNLKKQ